MKELNYSRQREAILNQLGNRYDHPTAEKLYEELRVNYPRISLGTVYRNLSVLAERGVIARLTDTEGQVRFDWNAKPHLHFACRKCGRVVDVSDVDTVSLCKMLPPSIGKTDTIIFYGECNCSESV